MSKHILVVCSLLIMNLQADLVNDGLDKIKAKKFNEAEKLLTQACKNNSKEGCAFIGLMNYDAQGIDKNYTKASKFFEKSCHLKHNDSCSIVGTMYYEGTDSIEKNHTKALKYYKKSCDLEDGSGCYLVADMYKRGIDIQKDYIDAAKYYKKSCDLKFTQSCINLSEMYIKGEITLGSEKKNIEMLLSYAKKACIKKGSQGCIFYEKLKKVKPITEGIPCSQTYYDAYLTGYEKGEGKKNTMKTFSKMNFSCKGVGKVYGTIKAENACRIGWSEAISKNDKVSCEKLTTAVENK